MFPYRVHTESESDIQKYNFFYKIGQSCQNTFDFCKSLEDFENAQNSHFYFVLCISSIIHILKLFVNFIYLCILLILKVNYLVN